MNGFDQCPFCKQIYPVGMQHSCTAYRYYGFPNNQLTEADVRRIVREELERAKEEAK